MAKPDNPPREWRIRDLLDLGEKGKVTYLKAIPVLILERWVTEGRAAGAANFIWTEVIANRLVESGLVSGFPPKGTSNILGALGRIQKYRNLTRPWLVDYQGAGQGGGRCKINLPHYEPLLQEYRQKYRQLYPKDYEKLFLKGEPEWEPTSRKADHTCVAPTGEVTQAHAEIQSLVEPVAQALYTQQEAIAKLQEDNRLLQAELAVLRATLQEKRRAPDRSITDDELRGDCTAFLKDERTYVDAIRRAGVVLEERLKLAIGGNGPEKLKQGIELVDYALRKDSGQLMVSEHPAEQEGLHMLFRGAVQFVRNPPAHKKVRYTHDEAAQAVGLIDYLLLLLRQAKPRKEE